MKPLSTVSLCATMLMMASTSRGESKDDDLALCKEWAGPPEGGRWTPVAETFNDVAHAARASEQLTLMALTGKTLVEIASKAGKEQLGSTYSITPVLKGKGKEKKAYFEVRFLNKGKIAEVNYDPLSRSKM
jgi:hypothetical protein